MCYRVSLQQTRSNFDEVMSEKFTGNLRLPAGPLTIAREIEMLVLSLLILPIRLTEIQL